MGEIVLVRHGQANSNADNERDYDRLSELGHLQARWLGEWLGDLDGGFDRILSGTLRRHVETAQAMGVEAIRDPRLDEMDYFNLGHALSDVHGVPMPTADGFPEHLPQVMRAWHASEIQGDESFAAFEARIVDVLTEAATEGRRTLCVTSAGVIAMAMRHVLDLDPRKLSMVLLPIRNTSIHRFHVRGDEMLLSGFNAVPHLERADRAYALTHY
ncbi:histidine phosphatase family protein [Palleronia sp. LCG004]|uniref:histidine phosphatase family protein n=1 Tax=Palleronia sp. LCG004 TaxID=3079304 RepID=UPI002943C884|nr:histidine phosphatase family protein [Palleronia sp. LCG004]WOI55429.1 histidine phosphatase family protein [Palleronia sp. LCG004]